MAYIIVNNPTELTWFVLSVAAFVMYAAALKNALVDSEYVTAAGLNGRRKLIADENVREELKRSFVAFINGSGAIASIILPSHRVGVGVGIACMVVMICFAVLNRITRQRLTEYIGDDPPNRKAHGDC